MRHFCFPVGALTVLLMGVALSPGAAEQTYWVGHLKVAEFQFAENRVESPSPDAGREFESADLTVYSFRVYQNPRGVVRHELSSISRNRGLEPGLDVRLFNYAEGYMTSFNKGARRAYKAPMSVPGGIATRLEFRQILGHRCKGLEMRWNDMNHYVVVIETWTAVDCDFRGPLFKVTKTSDQAGRLWSFSVEAIADLEKADHLEDSLFAVPAGLSVEELP